MKGTALILYGFFFSLRPQGPRFMGSGVAQALATSATPRKSAEPVTTTFGLVALKTY